MRPRRFPGYPRRVTPVFILALNAFGDFDSPLSLAYCTSPELGARMGGGNGGAAADGGTTILSENEGGSTPLGSTPYGTKCEPIKFTTFSVSFVAGVGSCTTDALISAKLS